MKHNLMYYLCTNSNCPYTNQPAYDQNPNKWRNNQVNFNNPPVENGLCLNCIDDKNIDELHRS